jgi:hypothetical protein
MRILRAAMNILRATVAPRTWQAFREVALERREVGEVAAELEMTPHAVSDAVYRVRCQLNHLVKRLAEAPDESA